MKRFMFILCLMMFQMVFSYPGKAIKSFSLPVTAPTGLTFDGNYLWIADHRMDALIAVNPKTGEEVKQLPSPGFWPMGLAWDGKTLWNLDGNDKKIYQIDPESGTVLRSIDAPGRKPEGLT